jgi:hypothetical protein
VSSFAAAALLAAGLRLAASHDAYPDGAPPGFSGGFREDSCHACHFSQDLNAPPGRVAIDGVPTQYEPGTRYTLTITLSRNDMKVAGFQLTARFKDGGAQAGTLAPSSSQEPLRVVIARDGAVQYANQNKEGSAISEPGIAKWQVEWVAPAGGGAVLINVAANAADGNGSADGDYVYTAMAESTADRLASDRGASAAVMHAPYSARNASIGSTRVAWRAGSHVASAATPPRQATTAR